MKSIIPFTSIDLAHFVKKREGETKLGERVNLVNVSIKETSGKFVLIGIPEDIGPRANHGNGGSNLAWNAFLSKFLNMQANDYIQAEHLIVAGEINVEGINQATTDINQLRKEIDELDKRVNEIILEIISSGKIPIVIGGGHNNCYPIISSFPNPIQVLNIDPHADLRKKEGRHSGNGFTYAHEANCMSDYFVLGLHEEYNSEFIFNKFKINDELNFLSFNDILKYNYSVSSMIDKVKLKLNAKKIGLEIDLDSIKNMPVSAKSPVGFSEEEVRKMIEETSKTYGFHYLHICEGAPKNENENLIVGKTIAYLVSDFIKSNS